MKFEVTRTYTRKVTFEVDTDTLDLSEEDIKTLEEDESMLDEVVDLDEYLNMLEWNYDEEEDEDYDIERID